MPKKILFLSNESSFPANSGSRMRSYNFLETFKEEDFHISALYFITGEEAVLTEKAENFFSKIWIFDARKQKNAGSVGIVKRVFNRLKLLWCFLRGIPWEISSSFDQNFEKIFLKIVQENDFDIIFCRYIYLAKYLIKFRNHIKARIIVDLDDIEPIKIARSIKATTSRWSYARYRLLLNNKFFENYHRELRIIDGCIVCSNDDQDYVAKRKWCKNTYIIRNSVDVNRYSKIRDFSQDVLNRKTLLFCGDLAYGANVQGLKWFLDGVWPKMQKKDSSLRLQIVGRNPHESISRYADGESVILFPNVPDVVPYYNNVSIVIVPLHVAGGTRIKILESFAARRPVVSTRIGAEGLDLVSGKHFLQADDPESFADACLRLFNNFELSENLVCEGYDFVRDRYDGPVVRKQIKEIFNC